MIELIASLAETIGVSSSVTGAILFCVLALLASTVVMVLTGSTRLGLLASFGPIILGAYTGFLPLWVAFLLGILGVLYLGSHVFLGGDEGVGLPLNTVRSPESPTLRIEKSSEDLSQYINNLDNLLGVRTVNDSKVSNLLLRSDNKLLINAVSYDWYVTAKHPNQDVFKVVGIHKEDDAKNKVFLLGKSADSGEPFLTSVSSVYLEGDLEECLLWARRKDLVSLGLGENPTAVSSIASILPVVFVAVILIGAISWISGQS